MLNSAHVSIQRIVQQFCRHPTSPVTPRNAIKLKEFVRLRPWIWTSRKTVPPETQGYPKTAHGRTSPVLVNTQLHPSEWLSKRTLTHQGRVLAVFGSRCDVNFAQVNRHHNQGIFRHFSVQTRQQQKSTEEIEKTSKENGQQQKSTEEIKKTPAGEGANVEKPLEQLSLYQRFKKTYKEHGKVLVGVHLLTSCVWFGSFYGIVDSGVDIVAMLEWMGFSETITNPFKSSSMGNVALAYLMYKLATPARYTVTIGGTNMAIKYMRKSQKFPPLKQEDKLRSLIKEGVKDAKDQGTIKFKQNRATARANRRAAQAQRTKTVKIVGRKFISKFKWRRDRILLQWKTSRLNRKGSKKKNGNGAEKKV